MPDTEVTALYDPMDGPLHYPICAECRAPYILRWGMSLGSGSGWYWFRDCKHKTAGAETAHAEGTETVNKQTVDFS